MRIAAKLITTRLELRALAATDADAFSAAVRLSAQALGPWLPWAHADHTPTEALAWLDRCEAMRGSGLAHEYGIFERKSGEVLGGIGLNGISRQHRSANLGYWVRSDRHCQGIATEAVACVVQVGLSCLGLERIEIVAAVGNIASNATARRSGARHEATLMDRLILSGKPVRAHLHAFTRSSR